MNTMQEQVFTAIHENQLPDGSWPHPFGPYNAVWAAVLVLRYLRLHDQI